MNVHSLNGTIIHATRITVLQQSGRRMRSWFRIRMDLAFQPSLWILCEFGWRRV